MTRRLPADLARSLRDGSLDGFSAKPPKRRNLDGASIDRGVCQRATCEVCGHKGLEYRPFVKDTANEYAYRAFAVCGACGSSSEF